MTNAARLLIIFTLFALPFSIFAQPPISVSVTIYEAIAPAERESKYERPLDQALKEAGLGRVTGGESKVLGGSAKTVLDITQVFVELTDRGNGIPFLKKKLKDMHAPPGTWISYDLVSESVVPRQPARPQHITNAQAKQLAAVEPDQFKTLCQCTEINGWLSLNRKNDQWYLSKLEMEPDEFSGFLQPKIVPDGTVYYFRIKELKAGSLRTPTIANVKDVSQEDVSAVRFGLNPDFAKPIERKLNYFGEGENIEMSFLGDKYKFSYKVKDKGYYIYLSDKTGLFQIGEGALGDVSVDWVGDLNRDGRLDFILDGIENVYQLKKNPHFLFLSTANNCYRIVQHISHEDYLIGKNQSVVPPPNPSHQFCME
jgi:hypothetical protein